MTIIPTMGSISSIGSPGVSAVNTSALRSTSSSSNGDIETGLQKAAEQNAAYLNEAKALYEPYTKAGTTSLDEYMKLLTGGIDALAGDSNFRQMQDLAERKVMANRATSGLLRSGATASALTNAELQFANQYYGNRLNQLLQGVDLGKYGTSAQSSIFEKLGGNETDLASALANIQMQREGNDAMIKAAEAQASAQQAAAKSTSKSNLWGGIVGGIGSAIFESIFGD